MTDLMNTGEAALFWGVSQRQVCRLCAAGRVASAVKIGGRWFMNPMAAKPLDRRFKKPTFTLSKVLFCKDDIVAGRCQYDCPEYTIVDGLVVIIDTKARYSYMSRLAGGQEPIQLMAA